MHDWLLGCLLAVAYQRLSVFQCVSLFSGPQSDFEMPQVKPENPSDSLADWIEILIRYVCLC